MRKLLSMALMLMMVLTLFAVPAMAESINIREVSDNGTVTAEVGGTTIEVIANEGYYLYSATLDGEDITEDFQKTRAWRGYYSEEVWTYTLTEGTLAADAEVEVTYGYYNIDRTGFLGGDAEIPFGEEGNNFDGQYTSAVTIIVDPDDSSNHVFYRTGNQLQNTGLYMAPGETWFASFDAKVLTPGNIQVKFGDMSVTTITGQTGWAHYVVYSDYTAARAYKKVTIKPMVSAYLDNVVIGKITEGDQVPPSAEPTEFAVVGTTNNAEFGTVTPATGTVAAGEDVTFTVTPKFGYYVSAATLDSENALSLFTDVYAANTIKVSGVADDVELAVTFTSLADNDKGVSTDIATLPAVFADNETDTAVTFGKVLDNSVEEYGIYLTQGGVEVTSASGEYGPYFAVSAEKTKANGQFAVEFVGLEPGTYTATTYVKVDGTPAYGVATTFTVE